MAHFKINLMLFINLLSIFKVSLLETVHFTNSANKILRANNYTTYKVEVPNGDPITIIEANTPLINKNIKFNEVENTKYSINQNQDNRNHVMDLKTSLSMTVTPHNNDEYENLPMGEEESVTNDYSSNSSPEYVHHQHTMKTVYSPELLQKFLKDYANKVHSTDAAYQEPPTQETITQSNYVDIMKDKYESIEAEDDGNRRVSSIIENQENVEPNDVQERKRYRPGDNKNNYENPYNKNNGWVTLEAVPWSKSKVSKWQSSVKPSGNQNNYNYQGTNNNNGYQPRPPRPPVYSYDEDNEDDDYYNQKPGRPSYQNNQFYGGGSSSSSSHNRPNSDPLYSHQSSHHSSSFNNQNINNNYDNVHRPNRPYQPEIITDNRPPNFPTHNQHESSYDYSPNRPNSFDNRPNRPYNENPYSGSQNYNPYSNKDGPHPLSYPNSGSDGEWILVSTTKGYQFPKRNGQRAMLFKAQNGVSGTDTRKYDNKGIITAASQHYETSVSIKPPFQAGPTKTTQQQVKLTVLPLFTKKDENRPYQGQQQHYNNMEVGVYKPANYNGIIETEPSTQTIEESVAAAAAANGGNSIITNVQKPTKKSKRKYMKNYAVMRKNPGSDSTAVLAAVSL